MFDTPLALDKAVAELSTDKAMVEMFSFYKYFSKKILNQITSDLVSSSIKDKQVKGLIDYGQTAFVFETEDGDILKITSRDHFLGRKPNELDNPIKESQKLSPKSFCYYYLEEKTLEGVTGDEINSCVKRADELGYKVVDKRYDQFAKTKEGRVVIIDPECMRKKGIFGLLGYKLNKAKAYARIILK